MFRKPGSKRGGGAAAAARLRKEESSGEEEKDSEVIKEGLAKRRRKNPMLQSTRKGDDMGRRGGGAASSSEASSEDEAAPVFAFAATGTAGPAGPSDMGATATLDIETEKDRDAQSQFERVQAMLEEDEKREAEDPNAPKLYRGQAMYGAKKAKDTVKGNAASGLNRLGPVRAPQFLRQTVRWDYAPDICKDYKETGFCTFGDSCKFVHDRGDYKHGWELERDFEQGQLEPDVNYEIPEEEEVLPEECSICQLPFRDPVVTRCKHYFCERCALTAFKKSKKCRVCEQNTGGVFNIAKDLIAHMRGEGTRKAKREAMEAEERGGISSDDDDVKKEEEDEEEEGVEAADDVPMVKEEPMDEEMAEGHGPIKTEPLEEGEAPTGDTEMVEEGEEADIEIINEVEGEESGGENESEEEDEDEEEEEKEKDEDKEPEEKRRKKD